MIIVSFSANGFDGELFIQNLIKQLTVVDYSDALVHKLTVKYPVDEETTDFVFD